MKTEQHKKLLDLYMEGNSSAYQEKELADIERDSTWLAYTRDSRKSLPEDLEQSLKQTLEKKQQSSVRLLRRSLVSAAAIAIILLSTFLYKPWLRKGQMSRAQIVATLNEASRLFEEEAEEIIYEDEALVIYLK